MNGVSAADDVAVAEFSRLYQAVAVSLDRGAGKAPHDDICRLALHMAGVRDAATQGIVVCLTAHPGTAGMGVIGGQRYDGNRRLKMLPNVRVQRPHQLFGRFHREAAALAAGAAHFFTLEVLEIIPERAGAAGRRYA